MMPSASPRFISASSHNIAPLVLSFRKLIRLSLNSLASLAHFRSNSFVYSISIHKLSLMLFEESEINLGEAVVIIYYTTLT